MQLASEWLKTYGSTLNPFGLFVYLDETVLLTVPEMAAILNFHVANRLCQESGPRGVCDATFFAWITM